MAEKKILQAYALMSDGSMVQIDLPKKGKWIRKTYGTKEAGVTWEVCSECGSAMWWKTSYCPKCGAKMEEEE